MTDHLIQGCLEAPLEDLRFSKKIQCLKICESFTPISAFEDYEFTYTVLLLMILNILILVVNSRRRKEKVVKHCKSLSAESSFPDVAEY